MSLGRLGGLSVAVGVAGLLSLAGPLVLQAQQSSLSTRARNNTPLIAPAAASTSKASPSRTSETNVAALVDEYCLSCHDKDHEKGGLVLETIASHDVAQHPDVWEKVIRKMRARLMPPVGKDRPDDRTYDAVVSFLEGSLDRAAATHPDPGRTASIRRLTRTEYQNAVRDLLAVDIDVASLLPADESSYGFDNVTVGDLSPTLLDRYVTAAEKISRVAVGRSSKSPDGETIRIPADLTQEEHIDGLPVGTRGGALVNYTFPEDGEYEFQIRLTRDRDEHVEGLSEPHDLELLLDRARVQVFTVKPPVREAGVPETEQPSHAKVDQHLKVRVPVTAGPHAVGVTFPKKPSALLESVRQPYQTHFNSYRHPRIQPAIYSISIIGPYDPKGPGDTPSRRRIFVSHPTTPAQEDAAAKQILASLMRRAYRRPVSAADVQGPFNLYKNARVEGDFDAGIEMALSAVLVSPQFLFRVEQDPPGVPSNTAYRISDLELASRLSFFLWSSIPDEPLLTVAEAGTLHQPAILDRQVRRMLADPRSRALVDNFAAQWLRLRNLDSITPDMRLFPDFDDNLRQAFRQETELFVESIIREDRSALDLLRANYTFLNERLAKHYGIPDVYGTRFRRVALDEDSWRGGLLRQGSILTVTSYATRTSPVLRGKYVLDNFLGVPPPPPLPDVPALKDNTVNGRLAVRDRLSEHRTNANCAPCHNMMDPLGLSLEKYDAVGRRRTIEAGAAIDASGGLPDGSKFGDVNGLETALLRRPELFVGTLTEKLMTYALGRGVEYYDGPATRAIVRDARAQNFRMSSIIMGIVKSQPFQMRKSK
jgi:Protein of unknown function (DUF1592)/Protein of unknown function (DUF1588)/Protein of unknown function (DUF1587)/Protein of unknown function (DUF1585)/Protein of unknown function (DUF1595)/Cytochrome C oxidase, cbb3-type, subunit III